jgi:hypothetical protein
MVTRSYSSCTDTIKREQIFTLLRYYVFPGKKKIHMVALAPVLRSCLKCPPWERIDAWTIVYQLCEVLQELDCGLIKGNFFWVFMQFLDLNIWRRFFGIRMGKKPESEVSCTPEKENRLP